MERSRRSLEEQRGVNQLDPLEVIGAADEELDAVARAMESGCVGEGSLTGLQWRVPECWVPLQQCWCRNNNANG